MEFQSEQDLVIESICCLFGTHTMGPDPLLVFMYKTKLTFQALQCFLFYYSTTS